MTARGLHAQMRVAPGGGCPLWTVLSSFEVHRLVPGHEGGRPQVIVSGEADDVADFPQLTPVTETVRTVVCRLTTADGARPADRCDNDPCLTEGLHSLPVRPYNRTFDSEAVELCLAARECEVRDSVEALNAAGFDVDLQQLTRSGGSEEPELVVVDRAVLTTRQREVARLAISRGYSGPDPPPAAELADELGIEKSTFSEHMRAVRRKVGEQVFPEEGT